MSPDTPLVRGEVRRPSARLWIVLSALVLLGALALGVVLGRRWAGRSTEDKTTVRTTPSVIVAVRDLARLEGAEFRIDRVVSLTDKQDRLFGLVEAKDA